MFKAKQFPLTLQHQDISLPRTFSILVWNIHKENNKIYFKETLTKLDIDYPSDIWMFQEFKIKKSKAHLLERSYAMSCNMETIRHYYGVMTASNIRFDQTCQHLSKVRELHFISHKSALITKHLTDDGTSLTLVNLHAVNFVRTKAFDADLQRLVKKLSHIEGALILAGDFNNWSKKRMKSMHMAQNKLGLKKAEVKLDHHIKCVFNKPLDHLFYRGVYLQDAIVIDTHNISDHNPIYASFKI